MSHEIDDYQNALKAIMVSMQLIAIQHDIPKIIQDIEKADAIGPFIDPTLWMNKNKAMMEDMEIFKAALPLYNKYWEIINKAMRDKANAK